jgi:hypothetical protein
MISILEVLKQSRPNRASLAYRKPTRTKANDPSSIRKVATYTRISQKNVGKADVKGKAWGTKKMK